MNWLSQNWIWIVVAIAFVLFMRRGGLAGCGMGHSRHGGGGHGGDAGSGARAPVDPVSGKEVDTRHAITSYYGGRAYYFEGAETRQRFEASPEKYAAREPNPQSQSVHRHHGC